MKAFYPVVMALAALGLLWPDVAGAVPGPPAQDRPAELRTGGDDGTTVARRRKRRRRKARPRPRPAPEPEPAPEPAAAPAAAPTAGGTSLSRTTRIEFDAHLIKGQTTKAGEVQILERKDSELKSMVKRRTSFRDEIIHTVFPEK